VSNLAAGHSNGKVVSLNFDYFAFKPFCGDGLRRGREGEKREARKDAKPATSGPGAVCSGRHSILLI
jgi:hypothetical protein